MTWGRAVPARRRDRESRSTSFPLRRTRVVVGAGLAALLLSTATYSIVGSGGSPASSHTVALSSLPLRQRIVVLAESQVGYHSNPSHSYCNKFSAFWKSGTPNCPDGEYREEWCADFAAWVWREAGAQVNYQFVIGDLNSSAASFYEWGVREDRWHPVGSRYTPQPGDVAVYGLDTYTLTAAHVAIVTSMSPGRTSPNVVNGDGDHTGFSEVDAVAHQHLANPHDPYSTLSGYVSPLPVTHETTLSTDLAPSRARSRGVGASTGLRRM